MSLEDFLKSTQVAFSKKYTNSDTLLERASDIKPVTGIEINNPLLEYVLDRRFIAFGRAYLIYGRKGCSKTTLFYELVKIFQKQGGYAFLNESEHALDLEYAKKQGVDLDRLFVSHPESLEQAFFNIKVQIDNLNKLPDGTPVLIGLDSIAGCCSEYESDDKLAFGQTKVGDHARICSQFYRRIENRLADENAIFVAMNQLKTKIGAQPGAEDALIGGEAQLFHSTYHWKMARTSDLVKEDEHGAKRKIGSKHKITGKRNKLGREGNSQCVEFDLYIDGGIDWFSPLVTKLSKDYKGLVGASGAYYRWKGEPFTYTTDDGGEAVIEDKNYRAHELGRMIMTSPQAQDVIREVFGVPNLPAPDEVEAGETEKNVRRTKRRKKKEEAEDPDSPIVEGRL